MTLFFTIGGADIGNDKVRLVGGIEGLTAYADGNVATAGMIVDDPTGTLAFKPWQSFSVTETDCTAQPRCFTGYIYNLVQDRGPYINGAGRIWTFDISDLNGYLHFRDLRNNASKRPRESGSARMSWLLGSVAMAGLVYDNGMVQANTALYDEADYRQKYADEVLQDIMVTSPGGDGLITFVYWDPVALQPSLYYGSPLAPLNVSTLRISNVLADVDNTTTFAPKKDESLSGKGEAIYDGVSYVYKGVPIYRQRSSTYSTFGIHRDAVVETDRIGHLDTAEAHAELFLDNHDGRVDTITCTVTLPASKVNLIDAGMLVSCKFSHLDGYSSFTPMRVSSRTIVLTEGTNESYDLQLELTIKSGTVGSGGSGAGGAPDPGDFPAPPPSPIPQQHWYEGTFTVTGAVNTAAQGNSGTNTAVLVTLQNYTYSFTPTVINNAHATSNNMRVVDNGGFSTGVTRAFTSGSAGIAKTGSFTAGPTANPIRIAASVDHLGNGTIPSATIEFWIDPSWWVVPDLPENPLPSPGQWVYNDIPTPAPNGTTTTFYTTHPFAEGSMTVYVDRQDQTTGLISQDGGTGITGEPAGGDSTSRGPATVSYQTPNATASAGTVAGWNAARTAAGVNGVILVSASITGNVTASVAGQTWQLGSGVSIIGTVTISADDVTIQGGTISNLAVPRVSHAADRYSILDVLVTGTGNGILIEGAHDGGEILRCNFTGQSLDPIKMFIDTAPDGNVTGWTVSDNNLTTNNGHSTIAVNDGGGTNNIISYVINNNYINAGARGAGNGFGIEVWGGVNGAIGYNDLRGGGFLISPVRSQGLWIHHNLGTLSASGAYAFCESGGSDMTACIWEYNVINGDGTGAFIYHDTSSHDHTVRFNQVNSVQYFVQGSGAGGGYTLTDNQYVNVTTFIAADGAWGIPNPQSRNGAGFGPSGGSFTLAFAPKAGEQIEVTYQGR